MRHARTLVVLLWVVSLLAVAALAQQQEVPRQLQPPAGPQAATMIAGPDVAFRVDSWEGNVPVGRWVVRHPFTGNLWVEPRVAPGVRTLTAR